VPASRTFRGPRIARRPKRRVLWRTISTSEPITVAAGAEDYIDLLNVESTDLDEFAGSTLTRMLIDLYVWNPVGSVDGLGQWGVGIVALERDTVAATAFPDPLTDEANWIYVQRGVVISELQAATVHQSTNLSGYHIHHDLRGQRKIGVRDSLVLIMEVAPVSMDLAFFISTRILYKLS